MITVIADDITGAAEIAGICLRHGVSVTFDFNAKKVPDTNVWVIATNTRSLPESEAIEEIESIGKVLQENNITNVFKKIDSALRGFVIEETKALLKFIPKTKTFILPANPEMGRTIENGHYYINGKALNETSFAQDPDFPAHSSSVNEILGLTKEAQINCTIPDILQAADYTTYARQLEDNILPVGGSVFFEAMLTTCFPKLCKEMPPKPVRFMSSKYTLMIAGSTHDNSIKFVEKARQYFAVFEIPSQSLQSKVANVEIENLANEIVNTIKKEKPVIITTNRNEINAASAKQIEFLYAEIAKQILSGVHIDELYIEGGATAYSIINALNFSSFIPVNEFSRGVVRMKVEDKKNLYLTIKPGSYLWPEIAGDKITH